MTRKGLLGQGTREGITFSQEASTEKPTHRKDPRDSEETLRGGVGNCCGLVFHFLFGFG